MSINRLILASVAVKSVYKRFAALSEEEKAEVMGKVENHLSKNDQSQDEKMDVDVQRREHPLEQKQEEQTSEPVKPIPAQSEETKDAEKQPEKPQDKTGVDGIVDEMKSEVEQISQDGGVKPEDTMKLFEKMMEMVTTLLQAQLPKAKKDKQDKVASRIAKEFSIANRVANAVIAVQINRKDKDSMTDTGGDSKGLQKTPGVKPPREDLKNPFRTKNQTPDSRDPDLDNDPDKRQD